MAGFDRGRVVFKHKPEDFIVEEVQLDGKISQISSSVSEFENAKVDFGSLDVGDRRDFIMFDLEKINMDHLSAMSELSNQLKKYPHEIGYAGSKDKVAWTCQRISIFSPDMEKVRNFSHPNIILKNFRWGKHKLKIGDLKGNKFRVTLRNLDGDALKVLGRVRNTEYIPNLFGMQRFGSVRNNNFQIGKLILKGKYKEAIFAYLTGWGDKESKEIRDAKRRLKEEKNILSAGEYFPKELYVEHRIIEHLRNNKNDFIGAVGMIGEKVLLIMCQSVQSRIFNEIIERAIDFGITSNADMIVIPGFNMSNVNSKFGRIEDEVLKENDMALEDFKSSDIPFLSLKGIKRNAFFKVNELEINTEEDEIFTPAKKIVMSFVLDSGSYATTFLEYFFDLE